MGKRLPLDEEADRGDVGEMRQPEQELVRGPADGVGHVDAGAHQAHPLGRVSLEREVARSEARGNLGQSLGECLERVSERVRHGAGGVGKLNLTGCIVAKCVRLAVEERRKGKRGDFSKRIYLYQNTLM